MELKLQYGLSGIETLLVSYCHCCKDAV